jgi:hypothetical protein
MEGKETRPEKGSCFIFPSTRHGVTFQKTAILILTVVSISDVIMFVAGEYQHDRGRVYKTSSNKSLLLRDVLTCIYCFPLCSFFINVAAKQEFHFLMIAILPVTFNLYSICIYGRREKKHIPDGYMLQNVITNAQAVRPNF